MHDGFCFCCCSDITCSEMRKVESFGQQIMSKDKYTTIFLRQSYCVYLPSNIFPTRGESVYEQFTVYYIVCSLFSVRWYNCMNTKTYPFFCNNHKMLSNLELIWNEDFYRGGRKVWKWGNITWGIFTDILQFYLVDIRSSDAFRPIPRAREKIFDGLYSELSILLLAKSVAIETFFPECSLIFSTIIIIIVIEIVTIFTFVIILIIWLFSEPYLSFLSAQLL